MYHIPVNGYTYEQYKLDLLSFFKKKKDTKAYWEVKGDASRRDWKRSKYNHNILCNSIKELRGGEVREREYSFSSDPGKFYLEI